jgi:hypothetical protein
MVFHSPTGDAPACGAGDAAPCANAAPQAKAVVATESAAARLTNRFMCVS